MPSVQQVPETVHPQLRQALVDQSVNWIFQAWRVAVNYFTKGLADSTCQTYKSAENRFLMFCRDAALHPLPASGSTLCYLVATLARDNLKHSSIKAYLSAVQFLHIAEGFSDPFLPSLQRLQHTLHGIKRCETEKGGNKKERLPRHTTQT